MPYDEAPAFDVEKGHCLSAAGRTPASDVTFISAASSAVACKKACIDDIYCAGFERDPDHK
jgi:hypothetical protein